MTCDTCKKEYSPKCDWRQGRCPHHPPLIGQVFRDNCKQKCYNLFKHIGNWFKDKK